MIMRFLPKNKRINDKKLLSLALLELNFLNFLKYCNYLALFFIG